MTITDHQDRVSDQRTSLAYRCTLSEQDRSPLWAMWGPPDNLTACPNSKGTMVVESTGEEFPHRCRTIRDVYCNKLLSWDVRRAIALAEPDFMVLITGLTGDWKQDQRRVNLLRQYLRRDGYTVEWVWAIEPNPRDTGFHAHGWVHGTAIPAQRLQQRAHQVGLGLTTLKPVTYSGDFSYVMKMTHWNEESLAAYCKVNGAQILHATRGFWRNPDTGETLTRDQAVVAAKALPRAGRPAPTFKPKRRLPTALSPAGAARTRDRNASAPAGSVLVHLGTGEVLACLGPPASPPYGVGRIGDLLIQVPGHPLRLMTDGALMPVTRVPIPR